MFSLNGDDDILETTHTDVGNIGVDAQQRTGLSNLNKHMPMS